MKGLDKFTIFLTAVVFLGWGLATFFDKLAANKLGTKASFLYAISLLPSLLILLFYLFYGYKIWGFDRTGIFWLATSA